MSRLHDLLRQLDAKDPTLAKELRTEYDALADRRAFGLNFERHTPESVELPGRTIRKGDKVHVLPDRGKNPTQENSRVWRVTAIDRATGVASIEPLDATADASSVEPVETSLTELVVVAEFRDPIYPGLVSTGRIQRGGDKPFHTIINAENYHALQTLLFTHRGRVDCIYIDPPYNTGNEDWIYNDKYVAGEDHYRHSKWLAFLERRLLLARELLTGTGVIIAAIGDDEHHRLRLLMDQIFGPENFISDVVWHGGRKNDSRYVSNGADYMLIYAKSERALADAGIRWRERKAGVDDALAKADEIWQRLSGDEAGANAEWKAWLKRQKAAGASSDSVNRFDRLDAHSGRPISTYRDITWPGAGGAFYEVLHPTTGRPVKLPTTGWRFRDPARMQEEIDTGRVWFGADESVIPRGIAFLDEVDTEVALSVFTQDRKATTTRLRGILGDLRFPNPKDHSVIMRWLRLTTPPTGVILDFFGGSGTVAEAVMELNAEDGGSRQCLLVTNNEAAAADAKKLRKDGHRPGDQSWENRGVYEYVTRPRIQTVTTGIRPDGSTYSEGLDQNVEFFTLTYEAPLRISSNREFAKIAPLLWMRTGSQGRRIDDISAGWDVADTYGVLADLDQTEAFLKAFAQREADGKQLRMVFVVTDEDRLFASVCRDLPEHIEPVRLYEAYLRNFEIEAGRSTR